MVLWKLTQSEIVEIVLARPSLKDKKVIVETLKSTGEIISVTDGTNNGPALKTANVGFSMGVVGTEVAKEASGIILMDDNFSSIIRVIMWGHCVNGPILKLLQFQISTNVVAVLITFVTVITSRRPLSFQQCSYSGLTLSWTPSQP